MKTYITKNIDILIIIFLAVLLYLLIFTSKSLSPSNINLMMNGSEDLQQKAELNSGMSAFMNNVKSIEDIKYILCD